ncbi:hydrogen peroxide-inducible genes activator [Fulvimarina endophytica]|uniref:Hydrogen peroxide-inducible genes activator n=1 Tax=Fulvimarina endophytica TaxID=2293836 RepID=A0A371X4Y8_9HYPH|nr:hydrogen peroxide-inducible genes activator [Fulvimarina endophytica]RFC64291.1 hydrogen peroxide-inducible genes activator [Fulvimarina endophytica]
MLTVRQMRYFRELAHTLHFGHAARALNISQPALSGQIAQMEAFFGTALFERRPAGVTLTADGELVAGRIESILADLHDLESLASQGEETLSGRLRVGLIATVAPYLLPSLLAGLGKAHPHLVCEVRESVTDRLLADLKRGEIDCAVVALPLQEEGLATLPLFDDPFFLAAPIDRAADLPNPVPASIVGEERILLLEEGHCLRTQAVDICRLSDGRERAVFGATSLATLLRMVAGGLGATLIPSMAVRDETRGGGLAILPFAEPVPYRRLVLAFRPTTARRADFEAFARATRTACEEAIAGADPAIRSPITAR